MYDLIIIGAGPGGYTAAERAGARGLKVLLIEKSELGGVCLNEGCIPAKTLLGTAKRIEHAEKSAMFGVHSENVFYNLEEAQTWKTQVIETQRKGIGFLMKKYGVEVIKGAARFSGKQTVEVAGTVYEAKKFIIATGSVPVVLPVPGAEDGKVVTSTELLEIRQVPQSLTIIGGGVIGMEFASLFSMLGTEVNVIEMLPEIIPIMEPELAKQMRRAMKSINFHLSAIVTGIENGTVVFEQKGVNKRIDSDLVLMAVGRKPNIEGLGLEEIGVAVTKQGIAVNDLFQTSVPGIYAIGDVTGKSMFAHAASRMGEAVIEIMSGNMDIINFDIIPWAVYTQPEAAGCGFTEAAAKNEGYDCVVTSIPMRVNGRFLAEYGMEPGQCKIVVDQDTRELLGIQLVGGVCSEIIYGAALCMQNGITIEEICSTVFPHPSVSEIIRDAALQIKKL